MTQLTLVRQPVHLIHVNNAFALLSVSQLRSETYIGVIFNRRGMCIAFSHGTETINAHKQMLFFLTGPQQSAANITLEFSKTG